MLSLYYWLNLIGIVVTAIGLPIAVLGLLEVRREITGWSDGGFSLSLIRLSPMLFHLLLGLYVWKIVKKKDSKVPKWLACVVAINCVLVLSEVGAMAWWRASHSFLHPDIWNAWTIVDVITSILWFQYFRVSNRVRGYYGANAFNQQSEPGAGGA